MTDKRINKERMHQIAESIHLIDGLEPEAFMDLSSDFEIDNPPLVTIYLPIKHDDRSGNRDQWDSIEFKDQIKQAKIQLELNWDKHDYKHLLDKLHYLLDHPDLDMWREAKKGLAFFANNDACYVYNMDMAPTRPLVVVGNEYDYSQVNGEIIEDVNSKYKLLLLNADFFGILDGNDQGVRFEEFPADVKHYFAETFEEFDGDVSPLDYYSLEDHESPYHGWKSRNDVKKEEALKFFRYVNKVMNDTLVRDEDNIPVILVTAPEHLHDFREVCTFKSLYPKAIEKDPRGLTGDELVKDALEVLGA